MKAVVVYESLWGNTAAIADAIAEGIGPEAKSFSTAEATDERVVDADLLVAGAPVFGFRLPTEKMRETIGADDKAPLMPDLTGRSLRSWLDTMPGGQGRCAAFETRMRWSPGGATGAITKKLDLAGFKPIAKPHKFVVKGKYGPLRDGELDRARAWGHELAEAMK